VTLLVVGHAKPRMALGEGGFCYYFRAIPKEPKTLYDWMLTGLQAVCTFGAYALGNSYEKVL